ncbi:MAG: O-antigen ligase family protein [Eubacterium sp.]|nr:O-antigen ligase family protein [Eubacterium sp.]
MKLRISNKKFFDYVSLLVMVGTIMYIWSPTRHVYYILVPIMSLLIFAKGGKSLFKNSYAVLILGTQAWILCSDFLNRNVSKENIFGFLSVLSLMCLINYNLKRNDRFIWTMRNFFVGLSIIDIIWVLSDILNGTYSNSDIGLLGHKNYHLCIYLIGLGFVFYCSSKEAKKNKLFISLYIFLLAIMVVLLRSSTSAIAAVVFAFLIFRICKKRRQMFNLYHVLIIDFLIFYFVIYKQYIGRLLTFILQKLGRDAGFTGRSDMWLAAFDKIRVMPFYGYGDNIKVIIQNSWNEPIANHVHNFILHLIVSGGWIYLVLNTVIFLYAAHLLDINRNYLNKILFCIIVMFLIIGQTEILIGINNMLYPLLFMTSCKINSGVKYDNSI